MYCINNLKCYFIVQKKISKMYFEYYTRYNLLFVCSDIMFSYFVRNLKFYDASLSM